MNDGARERENPSRKGNPKKRNSDPGDPTLVTYFIKLKGKPLRMFSIGREKSELLFLFKSAVDAEEYLNNCPHIETPDDWEVASIVGQASIIALLEVESETFAQVAFNPPFDFKTSFVTVKIPFLIDYLKAGRNIQMLPTGKAKLASDEDREG
jgi:hypothetical protein